MSLFRFRKGVKMAYIKRRKLKTKVYKESVEQNLINWSFDNLYWIDERGKLIKSVQHVTPKHPPVKTLHHIKQKA